MFRKKALWRGLTIAMAAVLALVIGFAQIAETWSSMLDEALGTRSYRRVTDTVEGEDLWTYKPDYDTVDKLKAAAKTLAEEMQEEGTVLLKNNGALPLTQTKPKVSVFGIRSYYSAFGGGIGSSAEASQNVLLHTAFTEKGYEVNPKLVEYYKELPATDQPAGNFGMGFSPPNKVNKLAIKEKSSTDIKEVVTDLDTSITSYNDAAIVVFGRPGSEAGDMFPGDAGTTAGEFNAGENVLGLSIKEKEILAYAKDNFGTVIVLINSSSAMEVEYLKQDADVDAVLWIGNIGNYGYLGVADILLGKANPSGKLPDIYAADSTSSPAMQNVGIFEFTNRADYDAEWDKSATSRRGAWYLAETEGIYTGYKYYETRYADVVAGLGSADSTKGTFASASAWDYEAEVSYGFGYGLSYTDFTQTFESATVAANKKTATVVVKVKNDGTLAGKDVVQLYAQAPYVHGTGMVEKAAVQLMAFEKTGVIEPGKTETVTIEVDMQNLASYDQKTAKTYIVDEGTYYFAIGNGAHDALNNILADKGKTKASNGMDYDGDDTKVKTWTWTGGVDAQTFAFSKAGVKITNQLDDADLNYWIKDKVTYLSRNNWDSTWCTPVTGLTATDAMIYQLLNDTYTIKQNDDTSDILWNQKSDLTIFSMKGAAYDDERWEELLNKLDLREVMYHIINGNSVFPALPSIGLDYTTYLGDGPLGFNGALGATSNPDSPYYIDSSKESTDPNKAYSDRVYPLATTLAATFNKDMAVRMGVMFGNDYIYANKFLMWAPGMNLHRSPYNGRNHEYYSEDAILSGYMGLGVCEGAMTKGLIMAPKHFAFNDQESNRSGVAPFMTEQKARENELRSFQIAFEGGALGTMTTFTRIGCTFGNAHVGLMQNILRGEWDFKGYIVTDMVNNGYYMTLKESIMASVTSMDTLVGTFNTKTGVIDNGATAASATGLIWKDYWSYKNIKNDAAMLTKMKEGMHYLLYTFVNSNAMNGVNSTTRDVWNMTWWRALYISVISVAGVIALAAAGFYVTSVVKYRKEEL